MIKSMLILVLLYGSILANEITADEDLLNSLKKMKKSRCIAFETTKGETVTKFTTRKSKANGGMFYFKIFYDDYKLYAAFTQNNLKSSERSFKIIKFTYRETLKETDYYASMNNNMSSIFGIQHLPDNTIYSTIFRTDKNGDLNEIRYVCLPN